MLFVMYCIAVETRSQNIQLNKAKISKYDERDIPHSNILIEL